MLITLFSCKNSENVVVFEESKPIPIVEKFGFKYNDFNVSNDTIKNGDTFGSILNQQNLGEEKAYEIIEKVKDSFDVRSIRIGKPYILFRSKDRKKKLQALKHSVTSKMAGTDPDIFQCNVLHRTMAPGYKVNIDPQEASPPQVTRYSRISYRVSGVTKSQSIWF